MLPLVIVLFGACLSYFYYQWSYDPSGLFGDCITFTMSVAIFLVFVLVALGIVVGHALT